MFHNYIIIGVLFTVFVLFAFLLWFQNFSSFFKKLSKIPSPPSSVPVLGHLFDITLPTPEEHFLIDRRQAKEYYPIYGQWLFNIGAVNLLNPDDIEIVLSSNILIRKSYLYVILSSWLGTGLLTSDGAKWRSRRKLLTSTFHFSILQDFITIFNESTAHLVKNLESKLDESYINVIEPVTDFTLHSITETAMGIKLDFNSANADNYKDAVHEFGLVARDRMTRPWLYEDFIYFLTYGGYKSRKIIKTLHSFSSNVIREKKKALQIREALSYAAKKKQAMLDLLITAQKNGENISDEGIREEVDTFMFEGYDTTSIALTFILLLLANNQEIQEEVRKEIMETVGDDDELPTFANLQELPFTERCIKEGMRLFPSVPFIAREAVQEFKTATGYVVPKGTMIHIHIFDLHRNATFFPDPEKFDPDRFLPDNMKNRHPFAFVPFSAGPRNCIGQKFALLELKAALCGVLRKFYLEPIDKPEEIQFKRDLILRPRGEVRVKFLKRVSGQKFENRSYLS